VVGAGERATSSGAAIMQLLRRAGYGGRVVPVNPKGGTIFSYESVTSIAAIDPPVDLAVIVIRPDAILDAAWPTRGKTGSPSPSRRPWQGRMVRHHGASGRSDVQRCRGNGGSGRAAGALSGASRFRAQRLFQFCDHSDSSSSLNQKIVRTQPISVDSRVLHFCNFLWTCGYSMATIGHKRGGKRGASTG
jgi:hypothetical protein